MPLYEYQCTACQHRFERRQSVNDAPVSECPECGQSVRKLLFPVGVVFKGSGWYITDSRKPEPSASTSETATSTSAESKSETKTETKTESKPAAAAAD